MESLEQNIINIYGDKGKAWLVNLPSIINDLASHWQLTNIKPVDNMTFNYVAKALKADETPVILKLSCGDKTFIAEREALSYFNGRGSVRLLATLDKYQAMLLECALPGITLKSLYPAQPTDVMDCYIATMRALHDHRFKPKTTYTHISEWLHAIDKLSDRHLSTQLLSKAKSLKNELLASMKNEKFLHGDLHHDNILQHGDTWVAIDPKGVVGDQEFEIAAFDFMYVSELAKESNVKAIFNERINLLSAKANLNGERIRDWVFVRLALMAAWQIEDKIDPTFAIQLLENLF